MQKVRHYACQKYKVLDINDLTKQRASVFGHIDEFRTLILKKTFAKYSGYTYESLYLVLFLQNDYRTDKIAY